MITTFYPPWSFGGDAVFVRHLANALAQRGHEVHVVHCRDAYRALGGRGRKEHLPDHPNVVLHPLASPAGAVSPLVTHQTGRPLLRAAALRRILEQPFDVLHFHNVSLIGGPGILRYGRGIKLYTLHEYWLLCPTHLLLRFGHTPCERPVACVACTIAQRRPPQWWRFTGLLRRALRDVDVLLSPSRFGEQIHRRLGIDATFAHLPNFVPGPEPNRSTSARTPADACGEPYFLYVGRLEEAKGAHTLIPFFRRWRRARLLLAGEGREAGRLRQLAAGDERISLLGSVPATELATLYRGAIALILPSLSFELCPLVALEALREGTPVVARERGSLPEIVAESGGGVTYDDEAGLAAVLDRLLDDTAWRDALGRRGAAAQRRLWSTEAHLERYFEIIAEIAARRAATAPVVSAGGRAWHRA